MRLVFFLWLVYFFNCFSMVWASLYSLYLTLYKINKKSMLCLDLDTLVIVWVCFIVFCPQVSLLFASHNAPLSWEWHLINSILMSQWETDSRVWYWQTRAVWWSRSSHGAHVPASVCHQYMHSCSELVGAKKDKDNYILLFIFEVFMKSSISIIIAHSSLNKLETSAHHRVTRQEENT